MHRRRLGPTSWPGSLFPAMRPRRTSGMRDETTSRPEADREHPVKGLTG